MGLNDMNNLLSCWPVSSLLIKASTHQLTYCLWTLLWDLKVPEATTPRMLLCDQLPQQNTIAEDISFLITPASVCRAVSHRQSAHAQLNLLWPCASQRDTRGILLSQILSQIVCSGPVLC